MILSASKEKTRIAHTINPDSMLNSISYHHSYRELKTPSWDLASWIFSHSFSTRWFELESTLRIHRLKREDDIMFLEAKRMKGWQGMRMSKSLEKAADHRIGEQDRVISSQITTKSSRIANSNSVLPETLLVLKTFCKWGEYQPWFVPGEYPSRS